MRSDEFLQGDQNALGRSLTITCRVQKWGFIMLIYGIESVYLYFPQSSWSTQ